MEQVLDETLAVIVIGLLTVISPLAVAYVKRESWSTYFKIAVPIVVSIVLAIGYLALTGSLNQGNLIETIMVVYGVQQLAYTTIMRWWATILEQVNDPGRHEFDANTDGAVN